MLVLVLGGVLSAAFLAAGGLLYGILVALESSGGLPRHVLETMLAAWGIGGRSFLVTLSGVAVYGAFFVAVWGVVGRGTRGGWRSLGLRRASFAAFALVLPAYLLTLFVSGAATSLEAALLLHGHFSNPQTAILAADSSRTVGQFITLFVMVGLVGPIVEELVFRGMLYQLLRSSLPLWAAIALSAGLFALIHGLAVLLPALFVFGVALALVFEYTRSLYPSIVLHMVINTVALLGSFFVGR
ncbi:MAG: hypothetical protein NVSMB65_07300 [Chloroflexota bacterium]